jgi:hypothetical protein
LQVLPPFGPLGGLVGDLAAFPAGGSSSGGGSWRADGRATATSAGTGGGGAVAFMAGGAVNTSEAACEGDSSASQGFLSRFAFLVTVLSDR